MTEQQIVETLGVKVMGWSKEQVDFLYPAWNPLQNIANAWQVVEKLTSLGYDVKVYKGKDFSICNVYESSQGIEMAECEEETVYLAICNAVMKVFDWPVGLTQR